MIPGPWAFVLLAAAACRVWRLLSDDTILDKPRARLLDHLDRAYNPRLAGRAWLDFVSCPWCLGFWVGLAWWGAWLAWPHATLIAATPWAISLAVGLTASVALALVK